MPTYDYVCGACGHRFEAFQGMTAKKLRKCPKCGKNALERQVGAGAGLIFKGSGFYITDYKRAGSAPESADGGEKKEGAKEAPKTGSPSEGAGPPKSGSGETKTASAPAPAPASPTAKTGPKDGRKGRG